MTRSTSESLTETQISARYQEIRSRTEKLAEPLSGEDQCIQTMADMSPTKWHRAHTSWFFETFILKNFQLEYEAFDLDFGFLFNSYYEQAGPRHTRACRGHITRPGISEIAEYREYVDMAMLELLSDMAAKSQKEVSEITDLTVLGIHHEQQHQELILMDLKHMLSCNPTCPVYLEDLSDLRPQSDGPAGTKTWTGYDAAKALIGFEGDGFCFDNETPAHEVLLCDFSLANEQVSYGDWMEFIADGGYETATLWLSDGWYKVQELGWQAPEYCSKIDGDWMVFTLSGLKPINPDEPVCHISHYEADAFARWAGARLPTEFEWEAAARMDDLLLPMPVWEWTASPYVGYPGYKPRSGAVGEYNGKFMSNQIVLKGGCWATPKDHVRPSYRNYYPSHTRWHFSGLRLAR